MIDSSRLNCDHNKADWFHDCYILGVYSDVKTEHKAEIAIQCDECGAFLAILLHGIYRMSVHDFFWKSNDVSDVSQYMWPDMPLDCLADVLHISNPEELISEHSVILDKIRDEKMILLHITSAFETEILALCKSITVRE